jgi:hypothetical protein
LDFFLLQKHRQGVFGKADEEKISGKWSNVFEMMMGHRGFLE